MAKKRSPSKKSSSNKSKGRGNLMSKLKALQGSWKKGKPRKAGFPVPDDDYGMEIVSAIIEEARSSGRLQINYMLKVLDEGDYEGRECHKYAGLETDDNIDFAMGDLETLELELPNSIADLGPVLEEAAGLQVDVTVRTSDSFTNIDFNELLADDGEGDDDDAGDDDDDSGEPADDSDDDSGDDGNDDDNGDDDDNSWPTEDEIKHLKKADLIALAKELNIKTKKFKNKKTGKLSTKKLAQACIDDIYEPEED